MILGGSAATARRQLQPFCAANRMHMCPPSCARQTIQLFEEGKKGVPAGGLCAGTWEPRVRFANAVGWGPWSTDYGPISVTTGSCTTQCVPLRMRLMVGGRPGRPLRRAVPAW